MQKKISFSSQDKSILLVLTLSVFMGVSNVMVISPLLDLIKDSIGIQQSQYGIVLGAYPIFSLISGILMGPFSDRYGRRALLLLGLSGLVLCQTLTGFAQSFETLIVFRALSGSFGALINSSAYALVADYFSFELRPKAMGVVAGGTALAQIAGIPLGILIAGKFSWNMVFFAFAGFTLLLVLWLLFFLPTPKVPLSKDPINLKTYQKKFGLIFKNLNISLALFTYFLMFAGVFIFAGAYPTWLNSVFAKHGIQFYHIALLFTIAGIGSFAGSSSSGYFLSYTQKKLWWIGIINAIILLFIFAIPFSTSVFWVQFPLYFGMMLLGGFRFPVISNVIVHLVSINERGSIGAAISIMVQAASALGAFLSGVLLHIDSSFLLNVIGVAIFFLTASFFLLFKLNETPHKDYQ